MNRITDADIDAALHDQARADGYNAGRLRNDTQPCDTQPCDTQLCDTQPCDTPDAIEVEYLPEYEREPALSRDELRAGLFIVAGALVLLAGLVVLWVIRSSNS